MIFEAAILVSCIKLLLIPAYRSTDFEVHRNWLAITHNLPLKKWYFEETSEWTLDYPPLFAYFELILSYFAPFFDRNMLEIGNLNYASKETILFQRLSVILTDFLYIYGIYKCCSALQKSWKTNVVLPILLITNCGLIMVDHIHFQYNGLLYGILLLSIAAIFQEKYLLSAFWFAVLINMKHIYIYLAPAYFIYLLKNYCCKNVGFTTKTFKANLFFKNLSILGSIVLAVLMVTFLPFYDHLPQVFSRMFPFRRGLCHAYWAPNFWAIYNTIDKALLKISSLIGWAPRSTITASMTGGLVQDISHTILPNIKPITTLLLIAICMLPAMVKLWFSKKDPLQFLRCLVLCALTSFLFGWHVHEKAILMAIIPFSILAIMDSTDANIFVILCTIGHYSLFPLLFPNSLLLVKVLLLILHSSYAFHSLSKIYPLKIYKYTLPLLNIFESLYILGLIPLFLYENVIHFLLGLNRSLPYLPLMLVSFYCSIGIVYCWSKCYVCFLTRKRNFRKHKSH